MSRDSQLVQTAFQSVSFSAADGRRTPQDAYSAPSAPAHTAMANSAAAVARSAASNGYTLMPPSTNGGMSTARTTDDRSAIMAIVEGREKVGRGNIGIAVVDLKRATCCLYQVSLAGKVCVLWTTPS